MRWIKNVGRSVLPSHSLGKVIVAALAFAILVTAPLTSSAFTSERFIWVKYRGVNLMVVPPKKGAEFDVDVIGGRTALRRLRAAVSKLIRSAPFSAAKLKLLQEKGDVFFVYDPSYPKQTGVDGQGENLAQFRPNLFDNVSDLTDGIAFPVVVGRYLIKWSSDEFAAVLADKMVGNGMQHLEGRLETMAELDANCEAALYQEMAHQELGMNKHAGLQVRFRQQLEWLWCVDFKRYIRNTGRCRWRCGKN